MAIFVLTTTTTTTMTTTTTTTTEPITLSLAHAHGVIIATYVLSNTRKHFNSCAPADTYPEHMPCFIPQKF